MPFEYLNSTLPCQRIQNASRLIEGPTGIERSIEMHEAMIIILGTGFLAFFVAWGFTAIRKHVYKDEDQLDTSFDAGGKISAGLTATTIVSEWTWAATFLQSTTVTAKYGISGSMWYAAGATIQILLFSMLSVQLKTRAPGAKTYLQVIRARFGKRSHIVFCCYALVTNTVVTAMLMLGGTSVITSMVKVISVEYTITLVVAIIGGYSLIGGIGATFYVSYFITAILYILTIVFVFKVYEDDGGNSTEAVGNSQRVFEFVSCAKGPEGNKEWSYLTTVSDQGFMFGVINILGNFCTVFVDQAYWQGAVAAKPKQGVIGFILGGLVWFALPFSFSTALGLAYIALSAEQGQELLRGDEIDAGLIAPLVAHRLLGKTGELMMMAMILLAVTSTASAEVMGVTSILIYDIYALYLKPYRQTCDTNSCILCGKGRGRMANPRDKCVCVSMTVCVKCQEDTKNRAECRRAVKPDYKCRFHGSYRVYNDVLKHLKNWTLIWTTMAIIPLTVILFLIKVSLSWLYMFMGVLTGSAVIPIVFTMFWGRLTSIGVIAGSVGGTLLALSVWLGVASSLEGGLNDWWTNTGEELAMLSGNLAGLLCGGAITVTVSLLTSIRQDQSARAEIWENTRDIDNPLSPWMEKYEKELNLTGICRLNNRPSLQEVQKAFRSTSILSYSVSLTLSAVLVLIWPAAMVGVGAMSLEQFTGWVKLSEIWIVFSMVLMIFLPVINEVWNICLEYKAKQKVASRDGGQLYVGSSAQMGPKDGQSYSKQEKTSETAPSSWKNCPSIEETVHSNDIQIQTSVNINTETHGKDSRC